MIQTQRPREVLGEGSDQESVDSDAESDVILPRVTRRSAAGKKLLFNQNSLNELCKQP